MHKAFHHKGDLLVDHNFLIKKLPADSEHHWAKVFKLGSFASHLGLALADLLYCFAMASVPGSPGQ